MKFMPSKLSLLILVTLLLAGLNSPYAQPVSASQSASIYPRIWSIQAADSPNGASVPDLEIDSLGIPHLALGRDHLYYGTLDNGTWNFQLVDGDPGTGSLVSMAIDSNDRPHLVYPVSKSVSGTSKSGIRYTYWNGSVWVAQIVSDLNGSGWAAIAVDSSNRPLIVFTDGGGTHFAKWNGVKWVVQTIDTCVQAIYPSIAVDANGVPHISYHCNGLKYATRTGTEWSSVTLDNFNVGQGETSIALDGSGYPHIAYYSQYPLFELRYISWTGTTWDSPEIVDTNGEAGAGASLSIDSENKPHISYAENGTRTLKEAVYEEGAWNIQTVPDAVEANAPITQALDEQGDTHVVYLSGALEQVLYTYEENGTWTTPQLVSRPSWVGRHASMAMDSNNHPHISYMDYFQMQIRYSTWDGSQWVAQILDDISDWHLYSSIQVDSNNWPHVAYFGIGGLKYAAWDGSQWQIQSLGVGGSYLSLALDKTTDYPKIAFCSAGLKYISWNGASWDAPQSVDTECGGGDLGGEVSLTLDDAGRPHIAYHNSATGGELMYATLDHTSQWVKQVVADYSVGRSIALDSQAVPHIAYCGEDPNYPLFVIRYASWNGSSWESETAYPAGQCAMVSLAIDESDVPHISYPNTSTDIMYYVTKNEGVWSAQVVDAEAGWTGMNYVPIAVGPDQAPRIAYANESSGDLMVAVGERGELVSGNAAVPGATITFTGSVTRIVKTDRNGKYSFIVNNNWSGTVTPSKPGCTFTPSQRTYTNIMTDQPDQNFSVRCTLSYRSVAAEDGWVVETNENSNKGAGTNAIDPTLELGDNAANQQMLAILSFDTAGIPDNAIITKVTFKIKKAGVSFGTNPFNILGNLTVDIKKGPFGTRALQPADFQAAASKTGVLSFTNNLINNWYTKLLGSANIKYINKAGVTQFRLRFQLDDNNDNGADIIKFYSGNAGMSSRPVLIIQFKTP